MNFEAVLGNISLLNFTVASLIGLKAVKEGSDGQQTLTKISLLLFVVATLACIIALFLSLLHGSAMLDLKSLIIAACMSFFALLAHFLLRMYSITAFAAPISTLLMLLYFFQSSALSQEESSSYVDTILTFHIVGAAMGQILALSASIVAVLFLWQQRVLKKKLLHQLSSRVPALDILERVLAACLWVGFLFLTMALLSGAVYFQFFMQEMGVSYAEKIGWAVTVWLWYLVVLLARNILKVPMKRVAQMSLLGFLLLAVTFFGMSSFAWGLS